MKNNLPLIASMRKKWNDITLISALISKVVKDTAEQKLGIDIWEIHIKMFEKSIHIQTSSPLIASELWLFCSDIKKASQAKLLKLGYTLSDNIRLIIR